MIPNQLATKRIWILLALAIGLLKNFGPAQIDSAKIVGYVTDRSGHHYIAGVTVELIDLDRGLRRKARTDSNGEYVFADVRPSTYRLEASATGFQTAYVPRIVVIVQDTVSQSFMLSPGDPSSTALQARNADLNIGGTVGGVVDTDLVSNLPLNGRSFQTLFQLVPGVVIAPTSFSSQGQFSVNGERTDTNAFIVDGVSADFGIAAGVSPGQSAGGWLPALTVFGGTNSLVSTEAVQEFAVLTSSYSAEFGRVPGGQISIITKSGTNRFAGNLFEYLRNDALDANDWFANNRGLPRAALRQNDFGGVLGGPIVKEKTFFFASYEGLQLRQPTSNASEVPSLEARNLAPAAVKPYLNAYPLPNGPEDGSGLAQATYGFSNPSSLQAFSFRLDHHFRQNLTTFLRYAYSESDGRQRGAGSDAISTVIDTRFGLQTITVGIDHSINERFTDDVRFNWSQFSAESKKALDNFAGAIPVPGQIAFPSGFSPENSLFQFVPAVEQVAPEIEIGKNVSNGQQQINVVETSAYQCHRHFFKVGVDFRQLLPRIAPPIYEQQDFFLNMKSALQNSGLFTERVSSVPIRGSFRNYSAFGEDSWRLSSRISATFGIRWDFAGPPSVRSANGLEPFAVSGLGNLSNPSLDPEGTRLYTTSKTNFAPRAGFAYEIHRGQAASSSVRGGAGIYYDLSNGPVGNALSTLSFPFTVTRSSANNSFPLSDAAAAPPIPTIKPPFGTIQAFSPFLRTPFSYQWNLSLDQTIGAAQTVTISYVGMAGHQLLDTEQFVGGEAGLSSAFTKLLLTTNSGVSNFESLQFRFERRTGPAHMLAAYSLAHTLDNVSTDMGLNSVPVQLQGAHVSYSDSDFDIRHNASVGIDYAVPRLHRAVLRRLASDWSLDSILVLRSSPPVDPFIARVIGPVVYNVSPNVVRGAPLYLFNFNFPGGKVINPAALDIPDTTLQGNLSRNLFRGFPLFQADLAVRRSFSVTKSLELQFAVEVFNILNHPNFAPPSAELGTVGSTNHFIPQPGFGLSPSMLGQGLQSGSFGSGFSPLYQVGEARSLQIEFRIRF